MAKVLIFSTTVPSWSQINHMSINWYTSNNNQTTDRGNHSNVYVPTTKTTIKVLPLLYPERTTCVMRSRYGHVLGYTYLSSTNTISVASALRAVLDLIRARRWSRNETLASDSSLKDAKSYNLFALLFFSIQGVPREYRRYDICLNIEDNNYQ